METAGYIPDLNAAGTEDPKSMVTTGALRKKSKMEVLQSVATSPSLEISVRIISRYKLVIPKAYWNQGSKMTQKYG